MTTRGPAGQYYILERIAQGGMAEVFKGLAYDLHGLKRTVVIKKILPQISANPEFVDMLVDEAKIAVLLSHGNIAQVYDLGRSGNDYFIVMEYVDGWSVSQIQRACAAVPQPIPLAIVCYIVAEIAAGLEYIHTRTDERGEPLGIVHRDVSPQNIIVSRGGTVKIIDFGIAKTQTRADGTESGVLKGKFAYMAPEHANAETIDHRADIFSLGVIAYEMLTGTRLFKAKENKQTLRNVRAAKVKAPSRLRDDIPEALDQLVLTALAKTRETRFSSAAALRAETLKILYTLAPGFRESDVVQFLQSLFQSQTPTAEGREGRTPLLLSDFTQSAFAGAHDDDITAVPLEQRGVPLVLSELMRPFGETMARNPASATTDADKSSDAVTTAVATNDADASRGATTNDHADADDNVATSHKNFSRAKAIFISPATKLLSSLRQLGARILHRVWNFAHPLVQTIERLAQRTLLRQLTWTSGLLVSLVGLIIIVAILFVRGRLPWLATWRHPTPTVSLTTREVPAPLPGKIVVTSDPPDADIYMNDARTGRVTPALLEALDDTQPITIGVHKAGYKFATQQTLPSEAHPPTLEFRLEPDYGRLQIETTPNHAQVFVNGEYAGTTPLTTKPLMPDTPLEVRVTLPGYEATTFATQIRAGRTDTRTFDLRREGRK